MCSSSIRSLVEDLRTSNDQTEQSMHNFIREQDGTIYDPME